MARPFHRTIRSIPKSNGFNNLPRLSKTRAITIAKESSPLSNMLLPNPVATMGFNSLAPSTRAVPVSQASRIFNPIKAMPSRMPFLKFASATSNLSLAMT